MDNQENKQPDNQVLEDTEVNSPVEETIDEDAVSDDPVGDTTDEDDGPSQEAKSDSDPVTQRIIIERENAALRERMSYLEHQSTAAQSQAAEQERMALMSDGEKAQYLFEKMQNFTNQKQQELDRKLAFANFDTQDRMSFASYRLHQ
jgi:hypothetical protein